MPLSTALVKVLAIMTEKALATGGVVIIGTATTTAAITGNLPVEDPEPIEVVALEVVEEEAAEEVPVVDEEPAEEEAAEEATEEAAEESDEIVCDPDKNHGEHVREVARDKELKGREHGEAVSAMAQSDCGKKDGEADDAEDADEAEDIDDDVEDADDDHDDDDDDDDDDDGEEKPVKEEKGNSGNGRGNGRNR